MRLFQPMQLLESVLAAAVSVDGAIGGAVQRAENGGRQLRFIAFQGLSPAFIDRFRVVVTCANTSCAQAFTERRRVVIRDVRVDPTSASWAADAVAAGFVAVQSTPLTDGGRLLRGILSTQFALPHHPDKESLREIDQCARVAALVLQADSLANRLAGETLPGAAVYAAEAAARLLPALRPTNRRMLLEAVATNLVLFIGELRALEPHAAAV